MPELLHIRTAEFELSVWSNDIIKRQDDYKKTLAKRIIPNEETPISPTQIEESRKNSHLIRFSPPLFITQIILNNHTDDTTNSIVSDIETTEPLAELELDAPLFYENTQYQFEWVFLEQVENARLTHRSQNINEGFRFSQKRGSLPARLTGTINTCNDVGWMRLPLEYEKDSNIIRNHIAFEILPTKMDLHHDLPAMYKAIDQTFPLWRFSLVEKTEQDASTGTNLGHFPLMWLANFSQLRDRFEKGLKVIRQAPHSRLQSHISYTKGARLKGRIAHKLGSQLKEDIYNGQYDKCYRVEKKKLSVDTPENRFIKMVVTHSKKKLSDFERRLRTSNQAPEKQHLSDTFLNDLHIWQQPLQKFLGQSFLKEVGVFSCLNRESLVLQQKTGYSAVYRVWQDLKFYLDVFANQSSISMKSVSEIYEIWCFLCLKNILQNELDFVLISNNKTNLVLNDFYEYQLKDGFAGAFEFKRKDGVKARLAHEPIFTRKGKTIRSYLVNQVPDIVLEVTLPATTKDHDSKRFIWLFDAKYRIKSDKSRFDYEDIETTDYVPDDAINQMHRYRDALIRLTYDSKTQAKTVHSTTVTKSRPVFGAFALYPGYFDQETKVNPYAEAINEIGIGAFALLPSTSGGESGHTWLLSFLKKHIGTTSNPKTYASIDSMAENLYVQEAARIPYNGMQQVLYPDLTMTASLSGKKDRDAAYFNAFKQGTAKWYHLPKKTFLTKFKQHIANEIRYLALAITAEHDSNTKTIDKLWPVKKVVLLPRFSINEKQAGKISGSDELYYLFELGRPLSLQTPVINVPHRPIKNSIKLTTLSELENVQVYSDIQKVYQDSI